MGSSASTEHEFGSDGRPLHEPEGSIFLTNSHESDKTVKKLLTGLHREANSRFQDRSLLLEDLKDRSLLLEDLKGLGMAGDFSDDSQFVTMPFEDVHRLVTTMRIAEIILNERAITLVVTFAQPFFLRSVSDRSQKRSFAFSVLFQLFLFTN